MTTYSQVIDDNKFVPNVIVLFMGQYWAIRNPDGTTGFDEEHCNLDQVTINPTKIDPAKPNMTINSYSFKLLDKGGAVTALFNGVTKYFQNEKVEIYIGRCNVGMPFANYMKLPDTFVKSVKKDGNAYVFSTTEVKERLNKPAFNKKNKLEVNITSETTIIDAVDILDGKFPTSGLVKIDGEFISYTGIDVENNRLTGCIRGEKSSIPEEHKEGAIIYLVTEVIGNPIDILLQILISPGGSGGSIPPNEYDTLPDGAGILFNLINIERFETIRDEFFPGQQYTFLLYGIENILKFVEDQILFPAELRLVTDNSSKLSLAILNRQVFDDQMPVINEDTLKGQPAFDADANDIYNEIEIEYDYQEGTGIYKGFISRRDEQSVSDFGLKESFKMKLKGIKKVDGGDIIVEDIANRFLGRFSIPRPAISFSTHMDKSLINMADKAELISNQIPSDTGELHFAETVEILERGIDFKQGIVKFKIGFTSFTGIRMCYLCPSDSVGYFFGSNHKKLDIMARGELYQVGWKMRMYNNFTREYVSDQVNEIVSIEGAGIITFKDDWILPDYPTTPTMPYKYRIMFPDYDDATDTQKRYCFTSMDGLPFDDGRKTYQISL